VLGLCWTRQDSKQEPSEKAEGKGTHYIELSVYRKLSQREEMSSGVCASRLLTACSALHKISKYDNNTKTRQTFVGFHCQDWRGFE
jgi:hypothetical protein